MIRYLVRVVDHITDNLFGSAFFINNTQLLTCAHVVNSFLNREQFCETVPSSEEVISLEGVEISSGKSVQFEAYVEKWSPPAEAATIRPGYKDYALLKLCNNKELDIDFNSKKNVDHRSLDGLDCHVRGFPLDQPTGQSKWGKILCEDLRLKYEITALGNQDQFVDNGYSGGTVELSNGYVVGMIQTANITQKSAYFLPFSEIYSELEELGDFFPPMVCKQYGHVRRIFSDFLNESKHSKVFDIRLKCLESYLEILEFFSKSEPADYDELYLRPQDIVKMCESDPIKMFIKAPGGSGKSSFLYRLIENASRENIIPFAFDLSKTDIDFVVQETSDKKFGTALFNSFTVSGTFGDFQKCYIEENKRILIVVDRFNERASDIQKILTALDEFSRIEYPDVRIIIADRLVESHKLNGFKPATICPLSDGVIRSVINIESENVDYKWKQLLSNPFFLDLNCKLNESREKTVWFKDRVEMLKAYFDRFASIEINGENYLNILSFIAFRLYEESGSTKFKEIVINRFIEQRLPKLDYYKKLLDAGVLCKSYTNEEGWVEFKHQIFHDFLVGYYVAKESSEKWRGPLFDIVSLKASSFDAIEFALLQSGNRADELIKEVYDWNYLATLQCLARYSSMTSEQNKNLPDCLADAIIAIHVEKKFDKFKHTREKVEEIIPLLLPHSTLEFGKINKRSELIDLIQNNYLKETDCRSAFFREWKKLFIMKSPISYNDLDLLWGDPFLGWTASNVFKRKVLPLGLAKRLHNIYSIIYKTGESAPRAVSARWRLVHTLGTVSDVNNINFLINVICNQKENRWVRYGAVRSIIEVATLCKSRKMRIEIFNKILSIIGILVEESVLISELRRTAGIAGMEPKHWSSDFSIITRKVVSDLKEKISSEEFKHWEKLNASI